MRIGRAVVGLCLLLGLAVIVPNLSALARLVGPASVDPRVLTDTAGGGRTSVVVFLADQADVLALADCAIVLNAVERWSAR